MGVHRNIDIHKFPVQSSWVNEPVLVCFNYNTDVVVQGVIVRDDLQDPYLLIIKLDDGRFVMSSECQYMMPKKRGVTDESFAV